MNTMMMMVVVMTMDEVDTDIISLPTLYVRPCTSTGKRLHGDEM